MIGYNLQSPKPWHTLSILLFLLLVPYLAVGQSELRITQIQQKQSLSDIRALAQEFETEFELKRTKLKAATASKGWRTLQKLEDGSYMELQDITADGTPIYYTTLGDQVSTVSRANTLYSNGLLGLGIHGEGMRLGVWDAGIALTTHREFNGRASVGDGTNELNGHATMVMGTLIASGLKEKAQGVAHKATATTNNWTRDKIEVLEAASNGMLVSNHSYGIKTDRVPDWYFGSYLRVTQDWDNIMYNTPYYIMVTAAGNSQKSADNGAPVYGDASNGYDMLLGFATAKNGITVAAADTKIAKDGTLLEASVAGYSSFGPIDDGRIKPDIAGGGNNIYAAYSTGIDSYHTSTGTSLATPGVTGSMLLLQQYYEQLYQAYMNTTTLKGLVLHSADDVDALGPDYKMGWGVMNTKRAAEIITNKEYSTEISEERLATGETYTFSVKVDGTAPLMASLSWTDPASDHINRGAVNDATPALVNDLDIRITKDGQTYYPWKLSAVNAAAPATKGDNLVDPYERIELQRPEPGTYTISVTHKGTLQHEFQDFSLIVSGIKVVDCETEAPTEAAIGQADENSILLTWEPQEDAIFEVQYKAEGETEWETLLTAATSVSLENLTLETVYELQLRTICTQNVASAYTPVMVFSFSGSATETGSLSANEPLTATDEMAISVYPNPATEKIRLNGNSFADNARYRILNTSGTTIAQGSLQNTEVDVTQLSSGLYIICVEDLNGIRSKKFYKN
ncbi:S8 family serine peptidase [Eudoraea algarum]|uniref:S8 family serine peptidase n=1 Tax=Eudoraea algarum TaxID=3417568 RepID=UPI003F5D543A